jgi:hypothetical protein
MSRFKGDTLQNTIYHSNIERITHKFFNASTSSVLGKDVCMYDFTRNRGKFMSQLSRRVLVFYDRKIYTISSLYDYVPVKCIGRSQNRLQIYL